MDSSMTTSSELHVLPSPTKVQRRKNRHRRSNSKTSLSQIQGSPSKGLSREASATEDALDQNQNAGMNFPFCGPGMAIREPARLCPSSPSDLKHGDISQMNEKNLNDVCFGCDGDCTDISCPSSKRSSRHSADVESNLGDSIGGSPCRSPSQAYYALVENQQQIENQNNEIKTTTREKDSNENLNCPIVETTNLTLSRTDSPLRGDTNVTLIEDSDILNSAVIRTVSEPKLSPKCLHNPQRLSQDDSSHIPMVRHHGRSFRRHKVEQLNSELVDPISFQLQ